MVCGWVTRVFGDDALVMNVEMMMMMMMMMMMEVEVAR